MTNDICVGIILESSKVELIQGLSGFQLKHLEHTTEFSDEIFHNLTKDARGFVLTSSRIGKSFNHRRLDHVLQTVGLCQTTTSCIPHGVL